MDKNTRRGLLSSVDSFGKPKWTPASFDDLASASPEPTPGESDNEAPSGGEQPAAVSASGADATPEEQLGAAQAPQTAWPPSAMVAEGESAEGLEPLGPAAFGLGAVAHEGKDGAWVVEPNVASKPSKGKARGYAATFLLCLGIFLLATLPRLLFLFFGSGTQNAGAGWYGDTYHHWQIAYFTKEIGLSQGFRLWDLKGMEYFWGVLHPMLLVALFAVTGSTDIVLARLLSIVFGSAGCVLVFYLGKRYWNTHTGVAAMLLAALNPVGIFNDASGMVEPIGIPFLLGGVLAWPMQPALAGALWAIAGMTRAEYWVFGFGLVVAALLAKGESHRKVPLALGWLVPTLAYAKFLLDRTGNPIYPIYWSFLGNAVGRWQADAPLTPEKLMGRNAFLVVLMISLIGIGWTLLRRRKPYLLYLLGFGNLFFLGAFVGLTRYAGSYVHYFWIVRIFVLPYMFLGILLAALLFRSLRTSWPALARIGIPWVMTFVVLGASQFAWIPIWHYFEPTIATWEREVRIGGEIADAYQGGRILIPEGDPNLTYVLVHFHGFTADEIIGQMYDPFAYIEGDPFVNWAESRETVIAWIEREQIRLVVFHTSKETYQEMVAREPGVFRFVGTAGDGAFLIYEVIH
jgi:hypothetical protein